MSAEPEQWAVELWRRACHEYGGASIADTPAEWRAVMVIQHAFEERTGQLIPAPSVDDVARAIANADLDGPDPEDYWQYLAIAAISAMQVKP